jgi:hypothetical protein
LFGVALTSEAMLYCQRHTHTKKKKKAKKEKRRRRKEKPKILEWECNSLVEYSPSIHSEFDPHHSKIINK